MKNQYLCFLALLLFGCELIVDVDIPKHNPKLTAFAFITTDSAVTLLLSRSINATQSDEDFYAIEDAIVTITHPDEHASTLTYVGPSDKSHYFSADKPVQSGVYKLRIQSKEGEIVESETVIPEAVNVLHSSINRMNYSNEFGLPVGDAFIELKIEDSPEEDYYFISAWVEYSYIDPNTAAIKTYQSPIQLDMNGVTKQGTDIAFSDGFSEVYFSDRLFKDQNKSLKFKCTYAIGDVNPAIVIYVGKFSTAIGNINPQFGLHKLLTIIHSRNQHKSIQI